MRNKVKIAKRLMSILLVFLFSINSFAAIVSDNDGSTFVTKAEFNALKKSFDKQIGDYNKSIDEKIDGAIASYLQGLQVTKMTTIENFALEYKITGAKYGTVGGKEVVYWTTNPSYVLCNKSTQAINYDYIWCLLAPNKSSGATNWQLEYRGDVEVTGDKIDRFCTAGLVVNNVSKMTYNLNGVREMGETYRDSFPPTTGFWNMGGNVPEKNETMPTNRNDSSIQISWIHDVPTAYYSWIASSYTETTAAATTAVQIAPYSVGTEYIDDKNITKLRATNSSNGSYTYPSNLTWIGGTKSSGVTQWSIWPTYHYWTMNYDNSTTGTPNSFLRGITHNTLKFNDYVTINKNNTGYLTDGFLLCECEKEGKLHIEAEVSTDGWIYIWRNSSPSNKWHDRVLGDLRSSTTVSNWTTPTELKYQSEFKTTSGKLSKIIEVQKNEKVWFTYLPSPSISGSTVSHRTGYIKSFETNLEVE